MQGHHTITSADRLSIHNDEGLRDLLRIHLAEPEQAPAGEEPGAPQPIPALLAEYRELAAIRYDFPVVLAQDEPDNPVVSLVSVVDTMLDKLAPAGSEGERLRRQVYRLETSIRHLAEARPGRPLSELWSLAAENQARNSDDPERARADLAAASAALACDGRLLACEAHSTRRIFEHAWETLQARRAVRHRRVLDELIARLSEVLEAERARAPRSMSPQSLQAALAGEHAGGIDFEALSAVLGRTRRREAMPARRNKRLRLARKVLESERALLPVCARPNARRRRYDRRGSTSCASCAEAVERFDSQLQRGIELIRAIRVANLELENRYREERHDRFFETFGAAQLTGAEYRSLPPLLVYLDAEAMSDAEKSTLVSILGSEMPVKVVVEVHELPSREPANAPPGTFTGWARQIAGMAVSLGGAFVMQTAASHLPRLAPALIEGLLYDGPALFCVYTAAAGADSEIPHYLRCASAVESRAFPSMVYSPGRGPDWASRFVLDGSPQRERDWPEHRFSFESGDGREQLQDLAYTAVDFLALDSGFLSHFVKVPPERWHANMLPVADYLALPREQTVDKVPYVYLVDGANLMSRVIVRRAPLRFARKCLANWRNLQELAGINNSHARRLLERERARLAEETRPAADESDEAVRPASSGASPPPVTPPPDATADATADATTAGGLPYIESELCTTCDDCIRRNAGMFAYDEARRAYIKDPGAGSYRDLVEAAENCPVCIIHPGKPLNAAEPGLDELQQRAAAFD